MTFNTVHRWVRRVWIGSGISAMAFLFWSVQAHGVPDSAFESDDQVRVTTTTYGRLFTPVESGRDDRAVVFLPGGMIDPDAYAPLVRSLAASGVPAAIIDVPWRLAPTASARATLWARMLAAHDDLSAGTPGQRRGVVVAGHSRGGMFASEFVATHPDVFTGLAIIGSTHPRDRDLSHSALPVLKILGASDCVAPVSGARANSPRLPASTRWIEIPGANHRQFGYYGWQLGDCEASISREEQHRLTKEALLEFVAETGSRAVPLHQTSQERGNMED